jgi:hypothetical protein
MAVPKRPVAQPVRVPGTSLRRNYVAPTSLAQPQLGDIVLWQHQQWDVVGSRALTPPDEAGYQPLSLMLERLERPLGKKRVIREHADSRDVVILGRQELLPGLPEPRAPKRPPDRG